MQITIWAVLDEVVVNLKVPLGKVVDRVSNAPNPVSHLQIAALPQRSGMSNRRYRRTFAGVDRGVW
jgi:hypothetical protein